MREKVLLCRPGMGEITDTVMAAIVRSGIREGVCVVTALDDKAAVVMTNREKADIRQDIMEDLDRMVPARVNRRGWMAGIPDMGYPSRCFVICIQLPHMAAAISVRTIETSTEKYVPI